MLSDFDVRASTHGAASFGLVVLFGVGSVMAFSEGYLSSGARGFSLIFIGVTYVGSMWFFGSNVSARLRQRIDLQAGSQGAAGCCMAASFIGLGVIVLFHPWTHFVVGVLLGAIALSAVAGILWFGIAGSRRNQEVRESE